MTLCPRTGLVAYDRIAVVGYLQLMAVCADGLCMFPLHKCYHDHIMASGAIDESR